MGALDIMEKKSMSKGRGTVRRRVNTQPVGTRYDKRQQLKARAYGNVAHSRVATDKAGGSLSKIRAYWRRATSFLWDLFSWGGHAAIDDLDLTDGAIFSIRRGAGAAWLRGTFHGNLKMISTRDGRAV